MEALEERKINESLDFIDEELMDSINGKIAQAVHEHWIRVGNYIHRGMDEIDAAESITQETAQAIYEHWKKVGDSIRHGMKEMDKRRKPHGRAEKK